MRFALFLAWAHIWRRPLQSALAVLGVGVGVGEALGVCEGVALGVGVPMGPREALGV